MAYFFYATGRRDAAQQALAATLALETSQHGGRGVPFCEQLTRSCFFAFLQMEEQREEEEARGSLVLTPQQAANEILKAVGKTTTVGVQSNVTVAGDSAYQLTLAPKDHRSLIGRVQIAIDAKYGMPLRVQVFAKGAASPAFQVGYTALSFTAPAAANLAFTPPPGAKVDKANLGAHAGQQESGQLPTGSGFGSYGKGWLTVASLPQKDLFSSFGTGPGASKPPASASAGSNVLGGDSQQVLSALLGAAKPVSGSWGSGTLLQTSLVSILMTGGEVYIGAVQPSVLYAAVGHTS